MIDTVSRYLAEGFGGLEGCKSVRLSDSFSLVISAGYRFYRCRLMSTDCILAVAVEGAVHTPRKVQKQLAQVEAEFGVPVVFVTKVLHPHDKERFLALRQPLIVPQRMAYLPFAGLQRDDSRRELVVNRTSLATVAQLSVLARLEHRFDATVSCRDGVELLGYSAPAVQNAFRELEYFGLGERKNRPGSRALDFEFACSGRALWDKARSCLVSPVKRVVGLAARPDSDCVVAGVDALAERGRLNAQPPTEFATELEGFGKKGVEILSTQGAPCRLQLWAYPPTLLGGKEIDLLSLVLSLDGEKDDRVRIEIEKLLEEFAW